jgi:putative oxidoreductase
MNETLKEWGPVVGRILIVALFLISGISKIPGWENTAGYMASKGVPMVSVALALTIVIEIGASLMIMLGFRARLAATVLFLWMIPVTLMMHDFWAADAAHKMIQTIMFNKNLSIMGALLLIMAFGSGPKSLSKD